MSVYITPAGSPTPVDSADTEGWTAIGWVYGSLTCPDKSDRPQAYEVVPRTFTLSFRVKGPKARQPWFLFGPYKHPRQVLRNGRKPR